MAEESLVTSDWLGTARDTAFWNRAVSRHKWVSVAESIERKENTTPLD
jgi:hypothetical protein